MSSDPMLPSVPGVRGRRTPWSYPKDTPSAPGKVPKRLSNVRFSLIRKITCSIGHRVSGAPACPPPSGPGVGAGADDGDGEDVAETSGIAEVLALHAETTSHNTTSTATGRGLGDTPRGRNMLSS
jgi:hypothetical protein